MTINKRIDAFVELGKYLSELDKQEISELQSKAASKNPWFTLDNITSAIEGICFLLDENRLIKWANQYKIKNQAKIVGVVMAGNIPMVGFHDLLCVLMSGNVIKAKLSSQDEPMMLFLINKLIEIKPDFEHRIIIAEQLKGIEAIIATGSDNSSRYFDYYFSKYPNIIRKNRTSCAVITNQDAKEALKLIGKDIFQYFGLGCRNVSKLYVPKGYVFDTLFESIEEYKDVIHHHKYNNNYDYNKSIYLVNREPHLDNGFLMLRQDNQLVSPISVLFYEEYENEKELEVILNEKKDKIQCIVSNGAKWPNSKAFGEAQYPAIDDYADGVDTMQFVTTL